MTRFVAILAAVCLLSLALPIVAATLSVEGILEEGKLATAYNPVLLDYLLEEGSDDLPEEQRKLAIDQLVTALKQDVEITPEEQKTAALLAASAAMAELLGGTTGEFGAAAGDATYDVWKGWVDSAVTLQSAGYTAEAEAFFNKCIEIYPYSDLKGRCAIALASGRPAEALSRLLALTEGHDNATINAALRLLGDLAGSEELPAESKARVVDRLTEFTGGLKKATYGQAACEGLVKSGNPRAIPTLQKLSKGMMNTDFHRCARRGLLLTFDDASVVPLLEKQLKGGKFSTNEPSDEFFAAVVLMEAGHESGYAWAMEEFQKGAQKKGGAKGFMKRMTSTEKRPDFRPALVTSLVRIGGDRSRSALTQAMGIVEKGSWLETWIAIGLLELDDTTHIELARQALNNPQWDFTAVRVATALAEHGDLSGIPALQRLYDRAAQGLEPETGKAVVAFLGGAGDLYLADRGDREQRLVRLRRQIANALATIDEPESVPLLVKILDDPEDSVRSAAAYALARMSEPAAASGLAKAIRVDYGAIGQASRNPTLHAHIVRQAAAMHPESDETRTVLESGKSSEAVSVQFLALSEEKGLGG